MFDESGMTLVVEESKTPSDVLAAMAAGNADLAIVEESASSISKLKTRKASPVLSAIASSVSVTRPGLAAAPLPRALR